MGFKVFLIKVFIIIILISSSYEIAKASEEVIEPPVVGDKVHGRLLFLKHCTSCHGQNGKGNGSGISSLNQNAANLTDGSVMNLISDDKLYEVISKGKKGKKVSMPAFGKRKSSGFTLNILDIWDTVSYIQTMYLKIIRFFPDAKNFTGKIYSLNDSFLKRVEKALKRSLTDKEKDIKVFAVYGGEKNTWLPEFIPQDPIRLDELNRKDKIGYLTFANIKFKKKNMQIAIAIDENCKIKQILTVDNSKSFKKAMKRYLKKGKRGKYKHFGKRKIDKVIFGAWVINTEAVYLYEVEERERNFADDL